MSVELKSTLLCDLVACLALFQIRPDARRENSVGSARFSLTSGQSAKEDESKIELRITVSKDPEDIAFVKI